MITKKGDNLKQLKATRDQRLKNIEGMKSSFSAWIKTILDDSYLRDELGTHMEKMRVATENEIKRLSEYFTYQDGGVDQPIYNADTAMCDGCSRLLKHCACKYGD